MKHKMHHTLLRGCALAGVLAVCVASASLAQVRPAFHVESSVVGPGGRYSLNVIFSSDIHVKDFCSL